MSVREEISREIDSTLAQTWSIRDGTVVPESEDVALAGGGVRLDSTVLYADLADSTELVMDYDARVAAKVFKCFLGMCTRVILSEGGAIRSFDGDRVMGIFLGKYKNTTAARCGLKINWGFLNLLKPKLLAKYETLAKGSYKPLHCTGIDSSSVLAVRGGIRRNNDLVWVGRAPNVAAKLSGLRETPFHTFITGTVYDAMADLTKISGDKNMWESRTWPSFPRVSKVFRSSWTWRID